MALLAWNVQGLGNRDTVRALKNVYLKYQYVIIFLSETNKKKRYLEKIRMKMKLSNSFYVEPEGIAWGLALWWSDDANISTIYSNKNIIDTKISVNGEEEWFESFIYGPLYNEEK
ncbi:hypothetical protein V6N11_082814 [Hibiscus sabdariffa]|uniref:Uncharacterized protein n=1 Tax=Hibiscus sabdariffa TaxID=183260 RepID=A0ABR2QK03_9ROSI